MDAQTAVSPEDQNVTFVELFFDLVFVFSVTQLVGLLHEGLNWTVIGQAVLVFWLVWWAWSQFTWALNAADTTHPLVELGTLLATAVAFFMAVALPDAFHGRALWFAVPYILVRLIGLRLHAWVSSTDPSQSAAVRRFNNVSIGGFLAVLAGALTGGTLQVGFWGLAIVLDLVAAAVGGQSQGWNLHPEHFVERHGLFVIIALGETLIVAAGQVTGALWTGELAAVAVLSVALTCALWWSYFPRAKPELERAMEERPDEELAPLARDAFSLIHFAMLAGIIAYAGVLEEALAHPGDPLPLEWRVALALGLFLFVGGMGAAKWRATGRLPRARFLLTLGTSVVVLAVAGVPPLISLGVGVGGVALVAALEQRTGGPGEAIEFGDHAGGQRRPAS